MFFGSILINEHSEIVFDKKFQFYNFEKRIFKEIKFKNLILTFFYSKKDKISNFLFNKLDTFVFFYGNNYNSSEIARKYKKDEKLSFPELISILYVQEGKSIFSELNGDFSLIIYDIEFDIFLFVRDHLGVVPFYFTKFQQNFYFSSDDLFLSNQLIKSNKEISPKYILSFFKTIDDANFFYKNVNPVLPAHFLEIKKNNAIQKKYWFPEKTKVNYSIDFEKININYQNLLKNAVDIRIDCRKKNSSHVSGGLDSAFISARLKEQLKDEFTIGFSQSMAHIDSKVADFNEIDFVNEIENHLKVNVNYTNLHLITFDNLFLKIDSNLASFHEFNIVQYCVKNQVDVIFSGYAGDDFASVNNYGIEQDLFFSFKWKFFKRFKPFKKKLKIILFNVFFPFFGIIDKSTSKMFKEESKFLKKEFQFVDENLRKSNYTYFSRRNKHLKAISNYGITKNIEYLFQIGNRSGIEYRFPLVDKRIIEFMLSIPSEMLVDFTGKYHNRILMRDLCSNYFSEKIYQRKSKSDPNVEFGVEQFYKNVGLGLIDNIDKYKIEIISKIVNFEKLEKSIENINTNSKEENESLFDFLICLEYCYKHLEQNDKIY